jgi:hypothetical protein
VTDGNGGYGSAGEEGTVMLQIVVHSTDGDVAWTFQLPRGEHSSITGLDLLSEHGLLLHFPFQLTDDRMYVKSEPEPYADVTMLRSLGRSLSGKEGSTAMTELPGMWEQADLTGGQTDAPNACLPAFKPEPVPFVPDGCQASYGEPGSVFELQCERDKDHKGNHWADVEW